VSWYDEELPAGFQEADFEQAAFEAESRYITALHARGVCTHGSRLGRKVPSFYDATAVAEMLHNGRFGNREGFSGEQAEIPAGKDLCTDCGALVAEWR